MGGAGRHPGAHRRALLHWLVFLAENAPHATREEPPTAPTRPARGRGQERSARKSPDSFFRSTRWQAYLAESLNRIKKNSNKKLADLHAATDAALIELQKDIPADQVQADIRTKIHIFFEPFRQTCDSKNVKVRAPALAGFRTARATPHRR